MSQPFLGEIRMFGGTFAPVGWAFCNGQTLAISNNEALFTLIGTTYGGDGQTTFQLPDLRGRIPVGAGTGNGLTPRTMGQFYGTETETLTSQQMPVHSHGAVVTSATGNLGGPANNALPAAPSGTGADLYTLPGTPAPTAVTMNPQSIAATGNGLPHENMMPFMCISFIIATAGVFPSRN